ncbi:MAG: NUDIX hydrolase [Christensenellaceae bacterium]|jgi:ADP-ribose pyrophosphatase YjhB (NUDIX family)|nr:NUDIX hydrolase [Christensenellaceae bacterium]
MKKDKNGLTEAEFLKQYKITDFERPSVAVDNLLFAIDETENNNIRKLGEKKLQVLLVKRDEHPYIDLWSLPGTFVRLNEALEDASIRCLKNKTKIKDMYLEQLYTFGDVDRDPRTRVLSISYVGLINKKRTSLNDDSNKTSWFTLKTSPTASDGVCEMTLEGENGVVIKAKIKTDNGSIIMTEAKNLAFDHAKVIFYGLNRIRNKLEYTDIAFSMLEKQFTMAELKQVYEAILDKKLSKANFQRKIKNKAQSLGIYKTGGFRPAILYKYKDSSQ